MNATIMSETLTPAPESGPEVSESELVARAREGGREAQEALAREYRQPCFRFALQLVGNVEDARDVTQDSLLRFLATLGQFDDRRPVLPWLRRIVRNRAIDLDRRRRLRRAASLDSGGLEGGGIEVADVSAVDPQRRLEQRELQRRIWLALEELTSAQREILVLRDYQDLSYREMAELLEVPMGTVMSRLHAARRALRRCLLAGQAERAEPDRQTEPGEEP